MSKYNKWVYDYIENIDITKVEWVKFDAVELREFYLENYLDKDLCQYVTDKFNGSYYPPLGMRYLSFNEVNNATYSYLLGIVDNNIGKKTIVAAMIYLENYYIFKKQSAPLTYISSLEVNLYFWNKGIFKMLCNEIINFVSSNQHIIITRESDMGQKYGVIAKFKEILLSKGFSNNILEDNFLFSSDLELYNEIYVPTKKKKKTNIKNKF